MTVVVEQGVITEVTAVGGKETAGIGSQAIDTLPGAILEAQSAEVDGVSGATMTSGAIKQAAAQAIAQAMGEEAAPEALSMKPGTYTAEALGFDHWMTASVTVSEGRIEDISVEYRPIETVYPPVQRASGCMVTAPVELLPGRILEAQSLAVDAVTGATATSNAVFAAVKDCLLQAGAAEASLYAPLEKSKAVEEYECQLVVVGGGTSGCTAAATAAEQGVDTIVLEQAAKWGGTGTAAGGMMSVGSYLHDPETAEQDKQNLYEDWMRMNRFFVPEPKLVRMFIENSGPTLDWLTGQDYQFEAPATFGSGFHESHVICPTYCVYTGRKVVTVEYFNAMMDKFEQNGGRGMLETTVTGFLYDGAGEINGVTAQRYDGTTVNVKAEAVILATGGFAGNEELVTKYCGYPYQQFGMTHNKGTGLLMGLEAGGNTCNAGMMLAHVQRPFRQVTGFDAFDNNIPFVVIYTPGLMAVNRTGERFQREDMGLDCTVDFMNGKLAQGDYYYMLVSQDQMEVLAAQGIAGLGSDVKPDKVSYNGVCVEPDVPLTNIQTVFDGCVEQGVVFKGDTLEELAESAGMDPEILAANVEAYNGLCEQGEDTLFGKRAQYLHPLGEGPYYAVKACVTMYCTTGALDIDENFNVVRPDGSAIEGLYAVGMDSMGVLLDGSSYPDYGGPACGWAYTSGRLAGLSALAYLAGK